MSNDTRSSSLDLTLFLNTQLGTAICLIILSPITIISNMLLLLTIFKDPLKCFRTPATYFIVALALVNFTTGVFIEPFFIMDRMLKYFTWSLLLRQPYKLLSQFGVFFSYVGLNSSFLLVLGLIYSQYIAITFPHRYRSIVTTRRVLACIIFSCVYFTVFILLQFAGVPLQTLFQVDLHLHSTLITVLLFLGSCMLLRSFRKFAKTSRRLRHGAQNSEARNTREHAGTTRRNKISEKQFTIVTLLLSGILIVCGLPHIILVHVSFYMKQETQQERLDIRAGVTIGDEMMFLKVALDAFIYAWRLTKYRRSLKMVLECRGTQVEPGATGIQTMENFTFQQRKPESSTSSNQ